MNWWRGAATSLAAIALLGTSLSLAPGARANTITTWATPTGTTVDGSPESAKATITESNNTLTIMLTNLQADPTSAGQEISGILINFGVPLPGGPATITSESGQLINIDTSSGTYTKVGTLSTSDSHWGANYLSTTGQLCLATANGGPVTCSAGAQPYDMIIGPPGSNGKYSSANASIGNFNPQVQNSASFVLTINGVSPSTVITGVQFQFGTPDGLVQGYKVPGPAVGAGLPGLVAGCGGLIAWLRRRRRPMLKTISAREPFV